jgi:hypothetical protein
MTPTAGVYSRSGQELREKTEVERLRMRNWSVVMGVDCRFPDAVSNLLALAVLQFCSLGSRPAAAAVVGSRGNYMAYTDFGPGFGIVERVISRIPHRWLDIVGRAEEWQWLEDSTLLTEDLEAVLVLSGPMGTEPKAELAVDVAKRDERESTSCKGPVGIEYSEEEDQFQPIWTKTQVIHLEDRQSRV